MKKILPLLLFASLLKGQTIIIDSILPKTFIGSGYCYTPTFVTTGTKAKVYMHSTGTWSPTYSLTLRCNNVIQVTGTYQKLVDSNFVWPITVNYCSGTGSTWLPVNIYATTMYYKTHICSTTGIEDPHPPAPTILKTETFNILGQIDPGGLIHIIYFSNGEIKRT